MITMRITTTLALATVLASPAFAVDFVGRRSKLLTTLVPAYTACTDPTLTHNPPLTFPACVPARVSSTLGFGTRGWGQVKVTPSFSSGRATDVMIDVDLYDVRSDDGTGAPFDGNLVVSAEARSTDRSCGGQTACTMIDLPGVLPFAVVPVPCGAHAVPPLPSGRCHARSSANLVVAGIVTPGHGMNVEISQIQVYHGSDLIFVQGLFLP